MSKQHLLPTPRCRWHAIAILLFFALAVGLIPTGSALANPASGVSRFDNRDITGTVTSAEDGEALIGVTVSVKGSNIGTITDINGNFRLMNVPDNAIIVFSYTGFATQEVTLGASNTLLVSMVPAVQEIDQVVVVGYGSERRKIVTNAVSRVESKELTKQPLLSAVQGIQGLASGVQVIGSGQPGSQPRVQIRGINTILTNENPLYVVDGVLTDDITNISVADVVSVDVLKDGAAAIYGSRASNGVVLITTKRGKNGKPVVSFDSYVGYRKLINQVEMANSEFYTTYTNEALAYDGDAPAFNFDTIFSTTNWFDEITQNGLVQQYNLGMSGGTDNLTYLFSAGYFSDQGVLVGADFSRITLRSNNEYKLNRWLKIGNVLNVSINNSDNKPANAFTDAYRAGPEAPVYDKYGNYGTTNAISVGNPVAALELTNDRSKGQRFQGSLYGEVNILPSLTFRSSWGFDRNNGGSRNFTPVYRYGKYTNDKTILSVGQHQRFYWVLDNVLSWVQAVGDDHLFRVTLGQTAENDQGSNLSQRATDVPELENLWYISQGDPNSITASDGGYHLRRASYFGRLNYSFKEKYNLSGILRRDGSSAFPADQKWGTFYGVGAAWILSEEGFLKNNGVINYLKLRGGYSRMGNDGISRIVNNELAQLISISNTNPYGFPGGLAAGITFDQVRDALATWETTNATDLGLEFSTLNNRLSGELAYYNKLTTAYIRVPTPAFVDADGVLSQSADVRNNGIEATLRWNNEVNKNFSYHIGGNATFNHNNVDEVRGGIDLKEGGLGNGHVTTNTVKDQPIGSFWVYQTDGIFQNAQELADSPHFVDDKPGDFRFIDQDKNGVLDDRDRIFVGSYQPKLYYGINLGINWHNFDLSIDCYGNAGNKVYNGKKGLRFGNENIEASRIDRWTPTNTDTNEPRASNVIPKPSTYFVESGDFFRINNVTLGYDLKSLLSRTKVGTARLYVAAQNPLISKKFTGFTPELPGSNALNSGIELGIYPSLATYTVGVNVTFE